VLAGTLAAGVRLAGVNALTMDYGNPSAAGAGLDATNAGALTHLAGQVAAVAVIIGRPARQVLDLGGLEDVGRSLGDRLYVFGQYGNERWSSSSRRIVSPRPPRGLATFGRDLPGVLRGADVADAWIEEKGLAIAVHTRRLPDAEAAYRRLLPALEKLAQRHGLVVEPGRQVVEVRAPGMHKGVAVRTLADELDAGAFLFAGDDLGDLEAFDAVAELRTAGLPTLLVCSASEEQSALVARSDIVVDGPRGVLGLLRRLAADARARRR